MMKNKIYVLFLILIIFLAGCSESTIEYEPVLEEKKPQEQIISICAFGDNLLHMPVVRSGKKDDGTYDFSHLFKELQPHIKNTDIAVIGQETIFGGDSLGFSGFPLFNSPSDMGKTLVNEGFDIVLHASNHAMDKGEKGILNTVNFWKNYPEVTMLGIHESSEDREARTVVIKEIKGAKVAFLNYTYGTNGIPVPKGKDYLVNVINEEKISKDLTYAEENSDFTIAFMHWGTEYSTIADASQKILAKKMCEWGADLIIGAHPHVVEPVEWVKGDNGNLSLVYYSLGNFVSRQKEAKNLLGGMASVKIKFDGENAEIDDYEFIPLVTHYNMSSTKFTVYPLNKYTDELAASHGVSRYDRKVSVEYYSDLFSKITGINLLKKVN